MPSIASICTFHCKLASLTQIHHVLLTYKRGKQSNHAATCQGEATNGKEPFLQWSTVSEVVQSNLKKCICLNLVSYLNHFIYMLSSLLKAEYCLSKRFPLYLIFQYSVFICSFTKELFRFTNKTLGYKSDYTAIFICLSYCLLI